MWPGKRTLLVEPELLRVLVHGIVQPPLGAGHDEVELAAQRRRERREGLQQPQHVLARLDRAQEEDEALRQLVAAPDRGEPRGVASLSGGRDRAPAE